jgi:hypothetical protein
LEQSSTRAAKNIKEQFKGASDSLRDFRRATLIATIALTTIVATSKEAAKYVKEAKNRVDDFEASSKTLAVTLGQLLSPALTVVSFALNRVSDFIEAVAGGFIRAFSFLSEFFANISQGPVQAFQQAMQVAEMAMDNYLKKFEETRLKVQNGMTLDKQKAAVVDLEKITVKANTVMRNAWIATGDAVSQLQAALTQASEMGRGWAKAAAGVSLAMAIMNTAEGVTSALANREKLPWPMPLINAAIIAAAGAIQVATIASTKFHSGGIIRAHNGLAVDEVPIIAQTGEGILSRRGMSALGGAGALNALNAGYGGRSFSVNNYIYNPVVRSDEDINKLTEEISLRLAREAERL